MRAVLIIVILVASAIATPTSKLEETEYTTTKSTKVTTTYSTTNLPTIIPKQWIIKEFTSSYATIAFQKKWYVQSITPTLMNGLEPQKCGFLYNLYPCTSLSVHFFDTTPELKMDINLKFHMVESSYNVYTGKYVNIKSLLSPAYPGSNLAIFNVITDTTYNKSVKELNPLVDASMRQLTLDEYYTRLYTLAIIGKRNSWSEYIVCAIVNLYDNVYSGPNEHILMLLTRSSVVTPDIYRKAFEDIAESGMVMYNMINVNHSIDLKNIPGVTQEEITGVTEKTVTKTENSLTTVNTSGTSESGSTVTKNTSTTTVRTSSIGMVRRTDFTTTYDYGIYPLGGDINILKNFSLKNYGEALHGVYYLQAVTPLSSTDNGIPSSLNTIFPLGSPQIIINIKGPTPWKVDTHYQMIERNYNILTGQKYLTRKVLQLPTNDGIAPYATFLMYYEKYTQTTITEATNFSYENVNIRVPDVIYTEKSMMSIGAFKYNKYLIVYSLNTYTDRITKKPVRPLYVYTRTSVISVELIDEITQEIYRMGYQPTRLQYIDQSNPFDGNYIFDDLYFYPSNPTPMTGVTSTKSLTTSTNTKNELLLIPTPTVYPTIIPRDWLVRVFENSMVTEFFHGFWYLQLTSITRFKDATPTTTGIFSGLYPSSGMQIYIDDTTPFTQFDFNMRYIVYDISYNLITGKFETLKSNLTPAYPTTGLAIFYVSTELSYSSKIKDIKPLVDKDLVQTPLVDVGDSRNFVTAIIGGDTYFKDYVVFGVVNAYENFYDYDNPHVLWVLTRSINPSAETYRRAYEDILASKMNPYTLMSVDHMPNLKRSMNTQEEINKFVKETTVTSKSSSVNTNVDGKTVTSNSSTTKTTTTRVSTVDVAINKQFMTKYKFSNYDLAGGIPVLENLTPLNLRKALSGKYYVSIASPTSIYREGNPSVLSPLFPTSSLVTQFENYENDSWDVNRLYMMLENGRDLRTNTVQRTRSLLSVPKFDGNVPYATVLIQHEEYTKEVIEEYTPFNYDTIKYTEAGSIYTKKYLASILAYEEDSYLGVVVLNNYKNRLISTSQKRLVYFLTRERILSQALTERLNQEILRIGFQLNELMRVDQTVEVDTIKLEYSYFGIPDQRISKSASSSSSSTNMLTTSTTSSVVEEITSSTVIGG